ncbi:MAG TPA: hypothetical protein VMT19_13375 [Thermoanaerobaculaceae bacterium]|nr:hypothetical protein [Thermoanaerobaculaceae bacterium]
MSIKRCLTMLVAVGATAGVALAQTAANRAEFRAEVKAMRTELAATALSAPPAPGGADTDSFGRNVQYDGLLQSGSVSLLSDCTPAPGDPAPGPDDRCVVLNAAPAATTFDLPDIGRLTIPGRSSHSLFCHWLTPIALYTFQNPTGVFQPNATFRLIPYVEVESSVLSDPSLIDPTTGLPFNGKLEASFAATYQDSQSLDVNQSALRRFSESRVCIGGFLSKTTLMQLYGLTEAQATAFFRHDVTLHFGLRGNAALVGEAFLTYGLRVVGD